MVAANLNRAAVNLGPLAWNVVRSLAGNGRLFDGARGLVFIKKGVVWMVKNDKIVRVGFPFLRKMFHL